MQQLKFSDFLQSSEDIEHSWQLFEGFINSVLFVGLVLSVILLLTVEALVRKSDGSVTLFLSVGLKWDVDAMVEPVVGNTVIKVGFVAIFKLIRGLLIKGFCWVVTSSTGYFVIKFCIDVTIFESVCIWGVVVVVVVVAVIVVVSGVVVNKVKNFLDVAGRVESCVGNVG